MEDAESEGLLVERPGKRVQCSLCLKGASPSLTVVLCLAPVNLTNTFRHVRCEEMGPCVRCVVVGGATAAVRCVSSAVGCIL